MRKFSVLVACAGTAVTAASAQQILFSTTSSAELSNSPALGGFTAEDIVLSDVDGSNGSIPFSVSSTIFGADAVHQLDSGNLLVSSAGVITGLDAAGNPITIDDNQIAEVDAATGALSVFFDFELVDPGNDVDAFSIDADGNFVFSFGLSGAFVDPFGTGGIMDGDLYRLNPVTNEIELIFAEDSFADFGDLDAVAVVDSDTVAISVSDSSIFFGGETIFDDEVFLINTDTLEFEGVVFDAIPLGGLPDFFTTGTEEDIDAFAFAIPAPGATAAFAVAGLAAARRRR